MELTILGSGTSIPSSRRGSSGYLLRSGSSLVLLDSGPGTLRRILEAGAELEELTHIFYSHNHVDHTADLVPFLFTSRNPCSPRRSPLTIAGSAGFLSLLQGLSRLYGSWIEAVSFPLELMELGSGPQRVGEFEVTSCPVPHTDSSRAVRLTGAGGRSLVYSGDTGESDDLADLASGCDLLLIESSMPDEERIPGHLTPALAGKIASKARPGRVLLTHFYPPCEKVDMLGQLWRTYDGEAALAEDLERFQV
jgi:ribonuclease BN (tRNA processing enzyme)